MMTGSQKNNGSGTAPKKDRSALLVQVEESLNLRNPKLRDQPRFLQKTTAEKGKKQLP